MANEIQYRHSSTGETLYMVIVNATPGNTNFGRYWDVGSVAWDSLLVADWDDYDVTMVETPVSSYNYICTFPGTIVAGTYTLLIFRQVGGSVSLVDQFLASGAFVWDGSQEQLAPTKAELDAAESDIIDEIHAEVQPPVNLQVEGTNIAVE